MSPLLVEEKYALEACRAEISISFPPVPFADDDEYIASITKIVNEAYTETENGTWLPGQTRTNKDEVRSLIRNGELVVAYSGESHLARSSPTDTDVKPLPIGCVFVRRVSETANSFGMLALEKGYQGQGVGRDLIAFVEHYSRKEGLGFMQVELLMPTDYENPAKVRLERWYERIGYKWFKMGDFAAAYPQLAPLLARKAVYKIYEKPL